MSVKAIPPKSLTDQVLHDLFSHVPLTLHDFPQGAASATNPAEEEGKVNREVDFYSDIHLIPDRRRVDWVKVAVRLGFLAYLWLVIYGVAKAL